MLGKYVTYLQTENKSEGGVLVVASQVVMCSWPTGKNYDIHNIRNTIRITSKI